LSPKWPFTVTDALGFDYGVTWNTVRRNIFHWKNEQVGQLEAKVKSFFAIPRLLRLLREYIIFAEKDEELNKYILQQHQTIAIERAFARAHDPVKRRGLIWHTQGSGKTFTMPNIIARYGRPTLVVSHNKTLAAQLYEEFKELFPENAVEYFVSYYDYYQPEAYIPQRDIYIEKDASRNDDLDRLRLSTTTSLMTRDDVIIVASVSCIFGLGSPEDYKASVMAARVGDNIQRNELLGRLADIQYSRNDIDFARGTVQGAGRCCRALALV